MVTYNHITWGQLRTQFATRLSNTSLTYFESAELDAYLTEALRTWSLMTAFWRDTGTIQTVNNTAFYDLTTLTNVDGDALLSRTVTDTQMVKLIQWHFLENPQGTSWTANEQFTGGLTEAASALQRRRDQFLSETGAVVTRTSGIALPAPPVFQTTLANSIISIRRIAFRGVDGVIIPLVATDIEQQRNYSSFELYTPGDPYSYSYVSARPVEVIFTPPFNIGGTLDVLSISTGATLDPANGVALGVPDDMSWIIKWGAMADLLSKDGPGRDKARADFCERKYRLGVELAKMAAVVVNAEINGVPMDSGSIHDMDQFKDNWQSSAGTPDTVASMNTMVAVAPCPNGIYSLLFDVVAKAPIPAADGDFVQIGREELDAIIDYAEHLALFKDGGVEFKATYRGAKNFFTTALAYNERLAAQSPNILNLMAQSLSDTESVPLQRPGGLGALQGSPTSPGAATINQSVNDESL